MNWYDRFVLPLCLVLALFSRYAPSKQGKLHVFL